MRSVIGFLVLVAASVLMAEWAGPIGMTRFLGGIFCAVALGACFARTLPVSVGSTVVLSLTGWRKAFAVIPLALIGFFVAVYAAEITCLSTKYKLLCA